MKLFNVIVCLLFFLNLNAQQFSPESFLKLQKYEQSLKNLEYIMFYDTNYYKRFNADSTFISHFVEALKTPFSFYYNFDSLKYIRSVIADDEKFKIYTWALFVENNIKRYRGVIQINTNNGKLLLYPLIEGTDFVKNPEEIISQTTENKNIVLNWIGCIYYNIILTQYAGKKYYTLLGLDEHLAEAKIKWVEVLYFNEHNKPILGGNFFDFSKAPNYPLYENIKRYKYIYSLNANAFLNYDFKEKRIYMANLVSLNGNVLDNSSLVPEGNMNFLYWENGKWKYQTDEK